MRAVIASSWMMLIGVRLDYLLQPRTLGHNQRRSFWKERTKELLPACAHASRPARAQADKVFFASFFFRKKKTLP
jgi:hypothetical protein